MARIEQVERDKLTARQQALYDDIMRTRPRGKLSGPFSVWIHRPDIAEPANGLANCFRVSPKLDRRLIELIVLLVCRDATAQYAWSAHFQSRPRGRAERRDHRSHSCTPTSRIRPRRRADRL